MSQIKALPPSPQVLPKVLEALGRETTTLEEIGELVALDPALTAKLLHYCNSVYFRGHEPVHSVPEAIGRVGFQTIYALVSAVTGGKVFNAPPGSGIDGDQIWRHSLTTAFGCRFIAEDIEEDSNLLFTAGLLHDVGRVILAQAKGAEYARLLSQAAAAGENSSDREKAVYGFTHGDVGAGLMESWNLPPALIEAVRFHHQPLAAGAAKKTAASVCVGDALAHNFEHPAESLDRVDPTVHGAMEMLGLGSRHMELYEEQMQESWNFVNVLIQMR
ncbi:MAG TPA: HDOD domain-containing protein [Verrucomicrobiae bacterium]